MAINVYDRDDLVRISLTVATSTGSVDPSPLKFSYWALASSSTSVTTLTYGVDNDLIKDNVGAYHVEIYANVEGDWRFEWTSTAGSYRGAQRGQFQITNDVFA